MKRKTARRIVLSTFIYIVGILLAASVIKIFNDINIFEIQGMTAYIIIIYVAIIIVEGLFYYIEEKGKNDDAET